MADRIGSPLAKAMERHRRDWEDLAELDPYWSILVHRKRKHRGGNLAEFFASGEHEVSRVLAIIENTGILAERRSALDFGCGVGRVTFPLAQERVFERCIGVDISTHMVKLARSIHPEVPGLSFEALDRHDLSAFPDQSFDLVLSLLVLQHQSCVEAVELWLREMARVLKPGGMLLFQLPIRLGFFSRWQLPRRAYSLLRGSGRLRRFLYHMGLHPIRMLAVPELHVTKILRGSGCTILKVIPYQSGSPRYESRLYVATR